MPKSKSEKIEELIVKHKLTQDFDNYCKRLEKSVTNTSKDILLELFYENRFTENSIREDRIDQREVSEDY